MSSIIQKPPNNYQYYVGQANLVDFEDTVVQINGPVANGLLQDLTIPGNTFVYNAQKLSVVGVGASALVGSAGDLTVTVNGTQIGGTNLLISATAGWRYLIEFQKLGNVLACSQFMTIGIPIVSTVTTAIPTTRAIYFLLSPIDFLSPLTIEFRGSAPGTGPIFQDSSWASIQ